MKENNGAMLMVFYYWKAAKSYFGFFFSLEFQAISNLLSKESESKFVINQMQIML